MEIIPSSPSSGRGRGGSRCGVVLRAAVDDSSRVVDDSASGVDGHRWGWWIGSRGATRRAQARLTKLRLEGADVHDRDGLSTKRAGFSTIRAGRGTRWSAGA